MEENRSRIRIAYFSVNDPLDRRSWSGITYYLGQSLQRNIGEVDFLGPVQFPRWLEKLERGIAKLTRIVAKREYYVKYSLLQNWYSARYLSRKMRGREYDLIFAPASNAALAFFRSKLPIFHIHDATFKVLTGAYAEFQKASRITLWEGEHLERMALKKSAFIVYTSQWAAQSAVRDYGVDPARIFVRPFGANMDNVPDRGVIFDKERNPKLTLLYLAVDWERKGGRIAFDALRHLHDRHGFGARLIVCGCIPPAGFEHPGLEVIPFLNKNKPEDHDKFVELLSTSHFLILPTRADCSLLVACESNAYGMPAISTAVGGVPDTVKDGVNGYCLPYEAEGDRYADLIAEIYSDKERYHRLIESSRRRYEDELNWDKWAERFGEIYPRVLSAYKQSSSVNRR